MFSKTKREMDSRHMSCLASGRCRCSSQVRKKCGLLHQAIENRATRTTEVAIGFDSVRRGRRIEGGLPNALIENRSTQTLTLQ